MSEKEKFTLYVAAYLVLIKDGQVLLLRRFNTGYQMEIGKAEQKKCEEEMGF